MSDRPGAEKFHDDHKQICEICRGLDEALVEAHVRLSDRVAEVERLRERGDIYKTWFEEKTAEVERLRAENLKLRARIEEAWDEELEEPAPKMPVLPMRPGDL